ncbi:Kinesin motor family protein [Striga hermonthica]|uniref:Kinesin motor family protein n=1 Tax=Striga hermonthica TaxID=68872 RepID=A0A9N7NP95_STRHE|nr:Kinesin motor family protein [Striga hermonthica]
MARPNSRISDSSRFMESISASVPFKSLLSKAKQKSISNRRSKIRSDGENIAPIDPNIQIRDPPLSASISLPKKSPSKVKVSPITEDLTASVVSEKVPEGHDPPVKVVVRIGTENGLGIGETSVSKVSKNSLCVAGLNYTFDSVFESASTQEDVYKSVGVPLVKDALAGYNTTILAYGQTGSGKTYTMWGPPSAMVGGPSVNGPQGIVPRIFQKLFSEIQKEQEDPDGRIINYQCRCSFLEVYDEKISDLLDPTQRDLEIKDDVKNGFYVENLTEEYVSCYEDVTQILVKGLSNRKTGTTRINSKSSRSHIMFTCIIESWCKESSSKCFGISKISRISLVDLAGFERHILENASRQHVKEGKYIKKSTSQIGRLVNILAERSQSGKSEDIPYRSSRLTHVLRESFGGNAKLSVICTISPNNKCSSETLSTLRFGLRAKLMKNEPVVNEITEDDVNDLSDQIRQLKEELMKARSSTSNSLSSNNHGYFQRGNVRASLNQLRLSLNRSLILPRVENDSEENLHINEDEVKELKLHIDNLRASHEDNMKEDSEYGENTLLYSAEGCETEYTCEHYLSCSEESENEEINASTKSSIAVHIPPSTALLEPMLSESPKINNFQRKSLVFQSSNHESNNGGPCKNVEVIRQSQQSDVLKSSLRSSKIFEGATESLEASLHRGQQIIDSAPARSSVSFSFEHLALKPCLKADKANASVQTSDQPSVGTFICIRCQGKEDSNGTDMAIEREKDLNSVCKDQTAQIERLNRKLEQCKCMIDQKNQLPPINEDEPEKSESKEPPPELIKEKCEIEEIQSFSTCTSPPPLIRRSSSDKLRLSLLSQSMQLRKSFVNSKEEFEKEREKWMEMESEWISLTDELRIEIESNRQRAEKAESELTLEKKSMEELDDALGRSVLGHARMIEHYTELQEKYNELVEKHRAVMEGVAEVKRAASKAVGSKGGRHGARFAKALSSELSAMRMERERERELLRKENRSLKLQLKDTAEAVHAAGEVLVRLREAEEAAKLAEEKNLAIEEENEKLRRQMEKLKRKHKMEMVTMKQYLAESRLPEAALRSSPLYREEDSADMGRANGSSFPDDDDQAWRAEFGAIYQEHY